MLVLGTFTRSIIASAVRLNLATRHLNDWLTKRFITINDLQDGTTIPPRHNTDQKFELIHSIDSRFAREHFTVKIERPTSVILE